MKHDLRYRKCVELVTESAGPTRFGSLWHLGQEINALGSMEAYSTGKSQALAIQAMRDSDGVDPFEAAKAAALMRHYVPYYNDQWRVVAVEVEVRIPLINPLTGRASRIWQLGGKIDLIVEIMTGPRAGFYVVEHKTSSEDIGEGSLYWKRLQLDDQITIYIDGARSLGYPVRGVIYDVVLRPGQAPKAATPIEDRSFTKPKDARPGKPCPEHKAGAVIAAKAVGQKLLVKDIPNFEGCQDCTPPKPAEPPRLYSGQRDTDETPDEYEERLSAAIASDPDRYYRRPHTSIVRLDDEMQSLRRNIWVQAQRIRADERAGEHPMHFSSCGDFHRLCDYQPLCTGECSINDETRYRTRDSAHPELSKEIQTA